MSDTMFHECRIEDAEGLCELIRKELDYTDVTSDDVRGSIEKMHDSDDYFTIVVEENGDICVCVQKVFIKKVTNRNRRKICHHALTAG